jgi:hypothetical protein
VADVKIEIRNLPAWRRAIISVGDDFKVELKAEFLKIAETIASKVQAKVPRGPTGRAAGSVKARATAGGASIVRGGQAAPYFPWLDFGGTTGRGHQDHVAGSGAIQRTVAGSPWNPPGPGLYVYPTLEEEYPATERAVDELMTKVGRDAGFEVRGSMV